MIESLDDEKKVREALRTIIAGTLVKRARHNLHHEGRDLTSIFIEELEKGGYRATTIGEIKVEPGERVPAFYIDKDIAFFGWIFWEQFTSWKLRKLWGSVIKNAKGDWDIQIPATRSTTVYANYSLKLEMDIDHPPEF